MSFAIGWDFSAFNDANYREDSTGVIDIPGTVTSDILADSATQPFKHEDPEIVGLFDGVTDQRVVLDLTKANNQYTDVDFVAVINANMDASTASKLYLHYKDEDNSLPEADNSTTAFETGASAEEITPLADVKGDPLDTFIDSQYGKHYDTRLVHLTPDGTRLRYLGMNFSKQSGAAVSVGRIIGGPMFIPDRQPNVGMQWGGVDTSKINTQGPGAYATYQRGRWQRTLTCAFQFVDEAQAYEFEDIFRVIGMNRPVFVVGHTASLYRTSMYGRVTTAFSRTEDWINKQNIGTVTFSEIVPKTKG